MSKWMLFVIQKYSVYYNDYYLKIIGIFQLIRRSKHSSPTKTRGANPFTLPHSRFEERSDRFDTPGERHCLKKFKRRTHFHHVSCLRNEPKRL